VDIERPKPGQFAAISGQMFSDTEAAYWHSLPETEKTLAFYRFWTHKEAFVKATGRGIALGLKDCTINLGYPPSFLRLPEGYGAAKQWRILEVAIPTQTPLCCAVVTDEEAATIGGLHRIAV